MPKTNTKTKTYRAVMLSLATSPITHMSGVRGNEGVLMREPVIVDGQARWVPVLSGNALRHRMVREPGARHLIQRWGLGGSLNLAQLNWLLHGGNLTGSTARVSISRTNRLFELFPLVRVLGCSLPDQIVAGALQCWRGILLCRENVDRVNALIPTDWEPADGLRPAQEFIDGYQYTRSDAAGSAPDLLPPADEEDRESNLMIFSGQAITPGAAFLHGWVLRHCSTVELGALLTSLNIWSQEGGVIGGQSGRGHGRLATSLHLPDVDAAACIAEYEAHIDAVRDEAVAFLDEQFGRAVPGENGAPAKKTRKAKA